MRGGDETTGAVERDFGSGLESVDGEYIVVLYALLALFLFILLSLIGMLVWILIGVRRCCCRILLHSLRNLRFTLPRKVGN
jgi:hypothetical protein